MQQKFTLDFLQEAANEADAKIPGKGSAAGIRKHTEFQKIVDAKESSTLRTEVSFKDGMEVKRGTAGSVRLDVVEYDKKGTIINVYDLKTGTATLTSSRIDQIREAIGELAISNVPVMEIHPH